VVPLQIPTIQLRSNGLLCIASDIHIGAEEHAAEQWQYTLDYCLENKICLVLNGDILENAIVSGSSPGEKLLTQSSWPTEQVIDAIDCLVPLAEKGLIAGVTRGNHDARTRREGLLDLCQIIAHVLPGNVPYWGIGGLVRVKVGSSGEEYWGVIQHGKRAGVNPWSEVERCFSLFPKAQFAALGHNHYFGFKTLWSIGVDEEDNEVLRPRLEIRTGSYLGRSDYIREMIVAPCPLGSPLIKFDKHGTDPIVDVETLSWPLG